MSPFSLPRPQPAVVEVERAVGADERHQVRAEDAEAVVQRRILRVQVLDEAHRVAAPRDHLVDVGEQRVAFLRRHRLVDAARDRARAVHALARGHADHFLPELAQQHALPRRLRMGLRDGDDVAPRGVAVEPEQQVGRAQMEEVQGVRLQDLAVVHQPADLLGGRRELRGADDRVERLRRREVVAHRADAAQPLDHHRHFPVRAALDELLEAAKLDDVQPHLVHALLLVEEQRHLAVALDARDRVDRHAAEVLRVGGRFQRERHGRASS